MRSNFYHNRFYVHRGIKIFLATIAGIIGAVVLAFLFGYFVQLLWNWLMPVLFKLGTITYWQGFGIVVLAKLIFGSFGGGHNWPRRHFKRMSWNEDWDWKSDNDWEVRGGWKQWKYYKDFWKEEGKAAFEKYIERVDNQKNPNDEPGKE